MRENALRTLRRSSEWIRKRFASKAVILSYHRINESALDPWALCVSPQHFAGHLAVLRSYAQPLHLQELIQAHRTGNVPHRAVVVTFDDGYADTVYHAEPILKRYNVPATVFVVAGQVGSQREFWWDELESALLRPGKLPNELYLKVNGEAHHWELGPAAQYEEETYQQDRDRRAWESPIGSRFMFYYSVWQRLRLLTPARRRTAVNEIVNWTKLDVTPRPAHLPLSLDELWCLADCGLVEIGAHTVNHSLLAAHATTLQREEIQFSKARLEQILNRPVLSFAYPHGKYTAETLRLVAESGFTCACTVEHDTVWKHSNRFRLPRFAVADWDAHEFQIRLLRWFKRA